VGAAEARQVPGGSRSAGSGEVVRSATRRIFAGVAVSTCGAYAAVTMAPVVVHDLTGSAALAGVPVAALLAGAGAGATAVAGLIRRRGARTGLAASYVLGAAGGLLCVVAAAARSPALLIAGVLAIGVGHAANQLARYAAADLHEEERRASVIGWMVSAQAIGAVLGPLLLGPVGRAAAALGAPAVTGPFALTLLLFAGAAVVHLTGAAPAAVAVDTGAGGGPGAGRADRPSAWLLPSVQLSLSVMVVGMVVMLLVMAVTPVHVHAAGHGLATVGAIMSVHTLGMFGLAGVAGRLVTRFGTVRVIVAGLLCLALATGTAAVAPPTSQLLLGVALFALGFGWCLGFVSGSSLLARGLDPGVRVLLQGRVEAVAWLSAAAAAGSSGLLLDLVGFQRLSLLAGALLFVPLAVLVVHRAAPVPRQAG
jgi:MFS family permease